MTVCRFSPPTQLLQITLELTESLPPAFVVVLSRCNRVFFCVFCSNSPITLSPNLSRLPATVDCQTPLAKKKPQFLTLLFLAFASAPLPSAPRKFKSKYFFPHSPNSPHVSSCCFSSSILFHQNQIRRCYISIATGCCLLNIYQTGLSSLPSSADNLPLLAIITTTLTTTPINTSTEIDGKRQCLLTMNTLGLAPPRFV